MLADQTKRLCCAAARAGCLWMAVAASAGCHVRAADAATTGDCENGAALTAQPAAATLATSGAPVPIGVPTTRLAFAVTATTSAARMESYYASNVRPALTKDRRVLAVDAFTDGSSKPTYYVQTVLQTNDPPSESLAIDILTSGTGDQSAAQAIAAQLERYFDAGSARILTARNDLSVRRGALGAVGGQP
jgi:hypothetical protein